MAHTDKTDPYLIRHPNGDYNKGDAYSNKEKLVVGRTGIKAAKRIAHKKNRRRAEPLTKMSGHGWGFENYKYCFSD